MTAINSIERSNAKFAGSPGNNTNRIERPSATSREIAYGDRLFARVVMRGRTIVEFMINKVSDLSELFGELRKLTRGVRGLAQLYVRNFSRGWSMERPMMLYATDNGYYRGQQLDESVSRKPAPEKKMYFPWESH